jgi:multicomponent Na+:H+ antiporter subunit E
MGLLFINIVLAFVWASLTGQFTLENLTIGLILGYLVLYLLRGVFRETGYYAKGWQILRTILFFLWELFIANLRVARDVLYPGPLRVKPRVIAIPIDLQGDVPLLLLSVMISLTPGTLLLDISNDRKTIFLHAIHAPEEDQLKRETKQGFERQVAELFSQPIARADRKQERK